MPFACVDRFVYFATVRSGRDNQYAKSQAAVDVSFEPNILRRH
jgi:hypothetical protein